LSFIHFGRSEADLTSWLDYFISTLADVFEAVRQKAQKCAEKGLPAEPEELRRLDHRARVVLGLFAKKETITSADVAAELGLSERMARNLLKGWMKDGWLEAVDPSRRGRAYSLSVIYRQYIGNTSAAYRQ
jgi:predicted HTH transcriptional regulator